PPCRPAARVRGRFPLLEAGRLIAGGRPDAARAVFDAGFEVAGLCEGAEATGLLGARLSGRPLPAPYDFRMRPPAP
ncbi:DUF5107 domain-containing protein, partial [Streptomyces sp. NPDC052687]